MTERFEFPFKENYIEVDGIRLHYVDDGSGPPILMTGISKDIAGSNPVPSAR